MDGGGIDYSKTNITRENISDCADILLQLQSFSCWYNKQRPIIKQGNLLFENGCATGILGKNGAGKTTLFNAIAGILNGVSYEKCVYLGDSITLNSVDFKQCRILSFAEDHSFPTWNLEYYISFMSSAYRVKLKPALVHELIDGFQVGRYVHAPFHELSSGNRKKCNLIAAFALQRPLLILDEPTDFLDFEATEYVYQLIRRRTKCGLCTVVSSHIAQTFTRCCEYLYIISDGEISTRYRTPATADAIVALLSGN